MNSTTKDIFTEWKLIVNDLGEYPENFDKIIKDLEAEIAQQPQRDDLYFLMAKFWEFYPSHVTSDHEELGKHTLRQAVLYYGKAIALSPKPEYSRERDALVKQFPWLVENPAQIQHQKNKSRYYQHSGKTEPLAFLYLIILCISALPVLAFVYAFMCAEISIVIIKLAVPILFGVLVGSAINMSIIGFGKTRNGFTGFLLAALGTVWAYWLQWIFFFVYMARSENGVNLHGNFAQAGNGFFDQVLFLLQNPGMVWFLIQTYIAVGHWNFFGMDINGSLLGFFLIIEFLVIFLVAVFVGFSNYDKPFDEINKAWFKYEFLQNEKYFRPEDQLVSKLENGNYKGLLTPNSEPPIAGQKHFSKFTLFYNGSRNYLTVENVVAKFENGKWREDAEELVQYIEISSEFAAEIRAKNKKILESPDLNISNMNSHQYSKKS